MTILQLRYFQATCKYNSVSKAAKEMNISQPSISNAIKQLENEFGITLFIRSNKSLSLTLEGKQFLDMVDRLLDQFDNVSQIMLDLGQKRNLIRLGIPPILEYLILPKFYTDFTKIYPNTEISITEEGSRFLMDSILNNICDIAFIPHRNKIPPEFQSMPVVELETVYCVHQDHPLAVYDSISIEKIAKEPIVMFKNSFELSRVISEMFKEKNISPNIILHTEQLSTVQKLIQQHIATGFISKDISESMKGVKAISLEEPLKFMYSLIWLKNRYMFSSMNEFILYIKKSTKL